MIEKVKSRLYATDRTITHFAMCVGLDLREAPSLINNKSKLEEMRTNYAKLLSILYTNKDSKELGAVIQDLEFLNTSFKEALEGRLTPLTIMLDTYFKTGEIVPSIDYLKHMKKYYDVMHIPVKRDIPDNFFELLTVHTDIDNNYNSESIKKDSLPVKFKDIRKIDLLENAVVSFENSDIVVIRGDEDKSIFFYKDTLDLNIKLSDLAKSMKRSTKTKEIKKLIGQAISFLVKNKKMKPMDILVTPPNVMGEKLRGKLTVSYTVMGIKREEPITSNKLVKDLGNLKIFRSRFKVNNFNKKSTIYLAYHDI